MAKLKEESVEENQRKNGIIKAAYESEENSAAWRQSAWRK